MLPSIFTIIFIAIIVALLIILFGPLTAACFCSVKETAGADVLLSWLHPSFLKCIVDIKSKSLTVFAFGKYRIYSNEGREGTPVPPGNAHAEPEEPEKNVPLEREAGQGSNAEKPEEKQDLKKDAPAPDGNKPKKTPLSSRFIPLKRIFTFAGNSSWRSKIFRWTRSLLGSLVGVFSVREFSLRVKANLKDPAMTGAAYGYATGTAHMLTKTGSRRVSLLFEPVFDKECFEAEAKLRIQTSLCRMCLPVVWSVITFPYLHTFVLYRRAKRIKGK